MNINLQSFRDGDQQTFKTVFDFLYPQIKKWMLWKFNNLSEEDAEDFAAEAFYELYHRRATIRDFAHIRQVLFLVCKHRVIDRHRAKKNKIVSLVSDVSYIGDESYNEQYMENLISLQVADELYYPMEEPLIESWKRQLNEVISGLPKMKRVILLLSAQGWSKNKIADKLGLKPQTVLNHRIRAMHKIEKAIPDAIGSRKRLTIMHTI